MPAVIAAAVIAAGCTTAGNGLNSDRPQIVDGLNVSFMSTVLESGFGEIRDRALIEPDIDELFVAALEELESIDRNISFEISEGRVLMKAGKSPVRELGTVLDGDLAAWTRIAIDGILAARQESEFFQQADSETFNELMFEGALSTLDRFSRYSGRRDAARNRLVRDGVMGLGVRVVSVRAGALVQAIVNDGPAATAGVMINDLIVAANDISLEQKSLAEVRRHLEGRATGSVTLTIRRPGEPDPLTIHAQRELIVPDTVGWRVIDNVAELHISSFNQRTAQAVEEAFTAANEHSGQTLEGLVLDLRGDPGGLLDQAIAVADLFLDHGSISELRGRHPGANQSYRARHGDITGGLPMVLIVDGKAASAAEILTAALQDNRRALVVGTVTLGKGSVQTIIRLPNNGEIALTWSRAASPSGVGLHGLGILPDICLSGEISPAGAVLADLFVTPNPMARIRPLWLNPPQGSNEKVAALRQECPAEARTDRTLDLEVARRIAGDPALLSVAIPESSAQIAVTP